VEVITNNKGKLAKRDGDNKGVKEATKDVEVISSKKRKLGQEDEEMQESPVRRRSLAGSSLVPLHGTNSPMSRQVRTS
jgi:hypothetical protein